MTGPEVTIGLPVRNGGEELAVAIESLLSQTYRNYVLVISDNESTDNTLQTVKRYADTDDRIVYIRQPKNLGNPGNFRFTLGQAKTPYFMWAAHDDVWSPTFVERNLAMLKAHPEAAASISKVELIAPDGSARIATGTYPIRGTPVERVRQFFQAVGDCSRYYALFRLEAIRDCFPAELEVFGFDWIVVALTLLHGDHLEVDEVLLRRERHTRGHYYKGLLGQLAGTLDAYFPLNTFTNRLHERLPPDVWRACRWHVHRCNLVQTLSVAEYRVPALAPFVRAAAAIDRTIRGRPLAQHQADFQRQDS